MNASLDTNVIIHLYNADFQDVLFDRFDKLIVYQFIRHQELKRHASQDLLKEFDDQIAALETEFNRLKQQLLFTGKYDSGDAILRLSSGAGGDSRGRRGG